MGKIFEHPRTISSILTYINWNPNKKRESKQKRVLEEIMTNSFIRTMENIRLQSKNFREPQVRLKEKILIHTIFKLMKTKEKEKMF